MAILTATVNAKAMRDCDDEGRKGPLHLVLECAEGENIVLNIEMDAPEQADDTIAALTKCREYIWGPMSNGR